MWCTGPAGSAGWPRQAPRWRSSWLLPKPSERPQDRVSNRKSECRRRVPCGRQGVGAKEMLREVMFRRKLEFRLGAVVGLAIWHGGVGSRIRGRGGRRLPSTDTIGADLGWRLKYYDYRGFTWITVEHVNTRFFNLGYFAR